MSLKGRAVLVVGGGGGIGLGIAEALASEGCRVAVAGRSDESLRMATRDSRIQGRLCDVTDRKQVTELFAWFGEALGSLDILVNSAGINVGNRMMANVDPADFDDVMRVNTTGTFNCIHAALPIMRQNRSGLIVNIVSLAGLRVLAVAGMPYCVSKFATGALGTFVNLEEAGNGIKVTNIYPGETNTPILDKRPTPPPAEKRARMLQPEDIAACVVAVAKLPPRAVVPELVITPPHMMVG
ncbi:MAG: SDR family oxidoreductase [Acidobacteria bacterium]|nr:SDR family oxidoreductase [Acidobacteriota bacterium]